MMNVFLIGVSEPVRKIIDMILSRFDATLKPLQSLFEISEGAVHSHSLILFDLHEGLDSEILSLLGPSFLHYKDIPIIFLIGEDEKQAALVAQKEAFILKKPFTSEELIASLSHVSGIEEPLKTPVPESSTTRLSELSSKFEQELKTEAHNLILQYCREHFAEIAEAVIRQEIKRISSEDFQSHISHSS